MGVVAKDVVKKPTILEGVKHPVFGAGLPGVEYGHSMLGLTPLEYLEQRLPGTEVGFDHRTQEWAYVSPGRDVADPPEQRTLPLQALLACTAASIICDDSRLQQTRLHLAEQV